MIAFNEMCFFVVVGKEYCYQWVLLTCRGLERLASTIDDIDVRYLSDPLISYFWKERGEGQPQ